MFIPEKVVIIFSDNDIKEPAVTKPPAKPSVVGYDLDWEDGRWGLPGRPNTNLLHYASQLSDDIIYEVILDTLYHSI